MKVFKIIMNVFGIIVASFLSILLVLALIATPVISSTSAFFKGKNIHKIISSVDYARIIEVQMGDYLSEEDIERFTDDYGRIQ